MRSLILTALIGVTAFVSSNASGDYSGAWTLDVARSKGLPAYYSRIRSHKLAVLQSDKELTVNVEVVMDPAKPDSINFVYRLDGAETTGATKVRTPNGMMDIPMKLKASLSADKALHITITRIFTQGDRTMNLVGTEDWALNADGRTLVVHRVDQMPQGEDMQSDMVFVRS